MSNIKHLLIITAIAVSTSSCTSLLTPERQAKLDQAAEKYEATTGITPTQTGGLLIKWFGDYNQAKEINELLKSEPIPFHDESTSAKDVRAVQASHVAPAAEPDAAPPGAQSPAVRNHTSLVAYQAASDRRCRGSYGRPSQAQADQAEAKQSSSEAVAPSMSWRSTTSTSSPHAQSWQTPASPSPVSEQGTSDAHQAAASATHPHAPHSTACQPDTSPSRSNPSPPVC